MEKSEIPQSFLKNHPEIVQVLEALEKNKEGYLVTTQCAVCNQTLKVTELLAIGVRTVTCGNGCTNYREKFKAQILD